MKAINVYVVFQADGIDHEITDLQIMDDPGALGRFSQALEAGTTMFKLWAEGHGGKAVATIQGGGVLEVSADCIPDLPELQGQYEGRVDCSVSIGVGVKLNEAQRALMAAQKLGRGKLRLYDSEVETELAEELSKADDAPPMAQATIVHGNKTTLNSPAAGGGMKGAQEPTRAAPAAPMTEASEHSENEALQNQMAEAPDPLSQFSALAEQSEGEQSQKEASDDEAKDDNDVKSQLVEILQSFREQAPVFEQLKESSPELYKTLVDMIGAMVKMGQQLYGQPEDAPQGGEVEQVSKTEEELEKNWKNIKRKVTSAALAVPDAIFGPPVDGRRFDYDAHKAKMAAFVESANRVKAGLPPHEQCECEHCQLWRSHQPNIDKLGKTEPLEKRSKNVREQTRNISDEQARKRVSQYASKLGIEHADQPRSFTVSTNVSNKPGINMGSYAVPPAHEVGHLLNMPRGRTPEEHQQWMDSQPSGVTPDEVAATHLGVLAGRRAGIGAKLADPAAVDSFRNNKTAPLVPHDGGRPTTQTAEMNRMFNAQQPAAQATMNAIDTGQVGFVGNKLTSLSSIHSKINSKMTKAALEAGKTGRHQVVLPVGSQKDASAEGTREAGKLKVATADGKTKWRSVRAGLVMAPDGSPVSSRNPGGGE